MRELKFRAWDKKRKRMFAATTINASGAVSVFIDDDGLYLLPAEQIELMQYTGLKDENGKEIYEGDVLESTWNGDKAVVVWNDVEGEWEHYADFNTHSKYSGSVVIGNIHENPELLKEEE